MISRTGSALAGCALLSCALALACPRVAHAQACCTGGTVLTPGRLNLHEDELIGLLVKGSAIVGSYDGKGGFVGAPKGASEGDFEEDLIASLRVLGRGQFTVIVPIVETFRQQPGLVGTDRAFGGGFGDLQVSLRWDAVWPGAKEILPGIALLASTVLPTGRPIDEGGSGTLGVDATGTGALQGSFGLALEQTYGRVLVNVTGSATIYSARAPEGVHTRLGPSFGVFSAIGYSLEPGPVIAATIAYAGSLASEIDGATAPMSARTQLILGLSAGYIVSDHWRIQAGAFLDPPVAHAGENETAAVGGTATLFRTW